LNYPLVLGKRIAVSELVYISSEDDAKWCEKC